MNFYSNCIICGSKNIKPLKNYNDAYLSECLDCNFIFSRKNPTKKALLKYYSHYPREFISPITIKKYRILLSHFTKYRKKNNVLEVGCGGGYFLLTAKKEGWKVFGTEFDKKAAKSCSQRGIDMHIGELSTANFEDGFFDVITAFELIEHINNPVEEVQMFYKYLRPGGLVYLTTPNFNSILRFLLSNNWSIISYPEHLSYYTTKSLRYLFESNGFKQISLNTSGISISRLRNDVGIGGIKEVIADKNSIDQKLMSISDKSPFFNSLKNLVNAFLNFTKTGDSIKAIYQKIDNVSYRCHVGDQGLRRDHLQRLCKEPLGKTDRR